MSLRFVDVSAPLSFSSTFRAQANDDEAAEARRLERCVGSLLVQAGDILEAAATWQRAGDHDRAIDLLTPLTSSGAEDAEHARVALADVLFELGRNAEADAELDALRRSRTSSVGACVLAGELLEDRGQTERALLWFNIALSRVDEQGLAQLTTRLGWLTDAATAINGRRRARAALGLPRDEWDRAAPAPPGWSGSPFPAAAELLESLNDDDMIPAVRTLFWPLGELAAAATRWPDQTSGADLQTYHGQLESRLRTFSERGAPSITLVPASVSGLQQFADRIRADVTDPTTRHAYMNLQVAQGQSIAWPSARNARCWCGSDAKYKKCCGAPVTT